MAITIDNAYVETFERNVRHLAQQSITRLRGKVMEVSTSSEKHNWDRLAAGSATQKTSARTPTPTSDLAWDRRASLAQTFHTGETFEQEDPVQMLIDPNSSITQNQALVMKRTVDDIIIAAATGDALDGDGVAVPFPASQTIGDGTGVITLDTILETQEKFLANDIDNDEPKCMVIGPTQQRRLMQLMEVTSGDFQNQKALATGMLPNWMGFDWIVSTRLLSPAAGQISCLAFSKKAIGMQVNKDITMRVAERTDLSFAWQVYAHLTMGAVRVEDEHIVELHLLDSVS